MTIAFNLALIALLILSAGLGGYLLSKARSSAVLERRSAAYRAQLTRLRRIAAKAEEETLRMSGDLDRSKRRLRRYELALYNQSMMLDPAPEEMPDQTARYDMPEIVEPAPSGHLDREVLQDVEKAVDVDRFRVHFVRREIA